MHKDHNTSTQQIITIIIHKRVHVPCIILHTRRDLRVNLLFVKVCVGVRPSASTKSENAHNMTKVSKVHFLGWKYITLTT